MTDWETVARKQLSLRVGDDLAELEDATHELKDALDNGEDITRKDIAAVRRALTQFQQTVEEDLTELTDADAYDSSAVGHVPPNAVGGVACEIDIDGLDA